MLMQFMFNLNTLSMVDVNGITHTLSGVAIPDGTLSLLYAEGGYVAYQVIIISEVGLLVNINIPANPPLTSGFSGTFLLTHDLVTPGVSISPLGGTLDISTVVVFS